MQAVIGSKAVETTNAWMTYNFDPQSWFDRERAALDARLAKGEISPDQYEVEKEQLVERYEALLSRVYFLTDY